MSNRFSDIVGHLSALRDELCHAGFTVEERAAVLAAEARNWHIDMKVMPELQRMLLTMKA